jgi:hypothetical protein
MKGGAVAATLAMCSSHSQPLVLLCLSVLTTRIFSYLTEPEHMWLAHTLSGRLSKNVYAHTLYI